MNAYPVALTRCDDYGDEAVQAAVDGAVTLLGGWEAFVQPNTRVLLKANLLMARAPERAATTHPAVVKAVARRVIQMGATPIIADSPGGPFTKAALHATYAECGMADAARETGALLNDDFTTAAVSFPQGAAAREFTFMNAAVKADAVINIAKLKTHGLTTMTGAVKNLFGLIPGVEKVSYHYRMPGIAEFSSMLVDVAECMRPALNIVDAVIGMEGEGPSSGKPRRIGAVIASRDPHAADVAGARLIHYPAEKICTLARAAERGLCDIGAVTILGESAEDLAVKDFHVPVVTRDPNAMFGGNRLLQRVLSKALIAKPALEKGKTCVGCGVCKRSCPPKAIEMQSGKPHFDYRACIRCYCCQELCPQSAIHARRPWALRLLK